MWDLRVTEFRPWRLLRMGSDEFGSKGGESAFGAGPGGSGSMSHPWQKTEPVGVKTDGLAKSEAYGLWQYDMTSRRCRQIARVEIQTHALHIYTHSTI